MGTHAGRAHGRRPHPRAPCPHIRPLPYPCSGDVQAFTIDQAKKYGEGGYGATFAAQDTKAGVPAAVKVIDTRRMRIDAIRKECAILEGLNHANVIQQLAHGTGKKSSGQVGAPGRFRATPCLLPPLPPSPPHERHVRALRWSPRRALIPQSHPMTCAHPPCPPRRLAVAPVLHLWSWRWRRALRPSHRPRRQRDERGHRPQLHAPAAGACRPHAPVARLPASPWPLRTPTHRACHPLLACLRRPASSIAIVVAWLTGI